MTHYLSQNNYQEPFPENTTEVILSFDDDSTFNPNEIIFPNSVTDLTLNGTILNNWPTNLTKLTLNIEQEQLDSITFPNTIHELEFDTYTPLIINKFPSNLKKLKVRKLISLAVDYLPMLESLDVSLDKNSEKLDVNFLPVSLKFLRIDNWIYREKSAYYDLSNLPESLETLQLRGVSYDYIPSTIENVILESVTPTDKNMLYTQPRKYLEINFTGSYLNCTLKVENVKSLKVFTSGSLRTLICDSLLEKLDAYNVQNIIIPRKIEDMKVSDDANILSG